LNTASDTFQSQFHRRWNHLHDPHVRALAWLLDAPDLLDPASPHWNGLIASLPADAAAGDWLAGLDRAPAALHDWLGLQPHSRLGRYAEQLMSFYFLQHGELAAHGVQVRNDKNETVGEFDFLLRQGEALVHWEFAVKFYLFHSGPLADGRPGTAGADYFVGPNLADTLGAKMDKILHRQLALGSHPAAQAVLPQPPAAAQALVKGWLFYHRAENVSPASLGLSDRHCRGFWCSLSELGELQREQHHAAQYAVLPRLAWLAPARLDPATAMDHASLMDLAQAHFEHDSMPLLVAVLALRDGHAEEVERGFIVPDDWCSRAVKRITGTEKPAR
jgi:hypothetical protein